MFKSDQANARVLDAPNPNITLSAVENTLRDLVSTNQGSVFAVSSRKGSANKPKCYRCQQRGHVAKDCPAPKPVSAPKPHGTLPQLLTLPRRRYLAFPGLCSTPEKARRCQAPAIFWTPVPRSTFPTSVHILLILLQLLGASLGFHPTLLVLKARVLFALFTLLHRKL